MHYKYQKRGMLGLKALRKATIRISIVLMIQLAAPFFIRAGRADQFSPLSYPENKCLNFDGEGDYVSCGLSTIFKVDKLTIEAWIKPTYSIQLGSNSLYGHPYGIVASRRAASGGTPGWWFYFDYQNGPLYFNFRSSGCDYSYHTNKAVWYNSSWYQIAVTYDRTLPSGNLKFYVNGSLDSQHTESHAISYGDDPLRIGSLSSSYYGGLIDEVRVWNVSRTQTEIQGAWNRTLDGTETANPSLVGYWRFDEGSGTTSHDYSSQHNDAAFAAIPNDPSWVIYGAPIVPEFTSLIILPLFMIATLLAVIVYRRKHFA